MKGSYVLLFLLVAWAVESTLARCGSSSGSSGRHTIKIVGRRSGHGFGSVPIICGFSSPSSSSCIPSGYSIGGGCIPSGTSSYATIPTSYAAPAQYSIPIQQPYSYSSSWNPYNQQGYSAVSPQFSPMNPSLSASTYPSFPTQYSIVPAQYPTVPTQYSTVPTQYSSVPTQYALPPQLSYSPSAYSIPATPYTNPFSQSFSSACPSCPPCICPYAHPSSTIAPSNNPSTASEPHHPEYQIVSNQQQQPSYQISPSSQGYPNSPSILPSQYLNNRPASSIHHSIQHQPTVANTGSIAQAPLVNYNYSPSSTSSHLGFESQYQTVTNQQQPSALNSAQASQVLVNNSPQNSINNMGIENQYQAAPNQQVEHDSAHVSQGQINNLPQNSISHLEFGSQNPISANQQQQGPNSAQASQGLIGIFSSSTPNQYGNQHLTAASHLQPSPNNPSSAPVSSYYSTSAQGSGFQASPAYQQSSSANSNGITYYSNPQTDTHTRQQIYNSPLQTISNLESSIYNPRARSYRREPSYLQSALATDAVQEHGPYDSYSSDLRYLYAPEHSLHQVSSSDAWPISTISRNIRSETSSAEDSDSNLE